MQHIFNGDVLAKSGENNRNRHVIPATKLRVEHKATQNQMICRFCQEARSTEHVEQVIAVMRL